MEKEIIEFLDFKSTHIKINSIKYYKIWLNKLDTFTKKPIELITIEDIAKFKKIHDLHYKGKTLQIAFTIFHSYFKFWRGEKRDCLNPERIVVRRVRAESYLPIDKDEHEKIIALLDESDFIQLQRKSILMMFWDTGMRINELTGIKIAAMNIATRSAIIETEKSVSKKSEERTIYWSEETHRVLMKYYNVRIEIKRSPYLYIGFYNTGEYSERLTARSIQLRFARLCKMAGISKYLVIHSYRHSRIQRWLSNGLSLAEIILLSGHSSIAALEHYLRLNNLQNENNARRAM